MSSALQTLPWVEPDSIKTDLTVKQVKFTVKDKSKFDLQAAQNAIGKKGYDNVKLLTGPTEQ